MDQLFDLIKDYGGYAGAASVLGLAVLSLLYFAQAREVRRLREWAGRAPERAAELEQRVSEAARRPAPAVQRQPAPARQPGQPQTAAAQAATKPAAANGQAGAAAPATAVGAGAAGAAAGGAAAAAAAGQGGQGPQAQAGAPAATPGAPDAEKTDGAEKADGDAKPAEAPAASGATQTPPTTPAPDAPAAGATPTPTPTPPPAAGDTGGLATPPPVPPRTAAARPRPQPTTGSRPAAPLRSATTGARSRPATVEPQRSRRLPLILGLAAVGVVLVGVALALMLGGGDGGSESAATSPGNQVVPPPGEEPASTTQSGEARPPGDTKVAVLNGTTIAGLAARTAEELKDAGYSLGTVADAQEQNRSATLVQHTQDAKREAQAVAKIIGVGNDAVSPLDVNTRTVAGDDARVVVTVGADQNQQSGQG